MDVSFVQVALIFVVTFARGYRPVRLPPSPVPAHRHRRRYRWRNPRRRADRSCRRWYLPGAVTIGNMPIGGAQPPNAVIGGIMAAVFACSLNMDVNVAVAAAAIPFALLGQYGVTLFFTLRAPMLESFRAAAIKADTKAITRLTVISEECIPRPHLRCYRHCSSSVARPGNAVVEAIPSGSPAFSAGGGM